MRPCATLLFCVLVLIAPAPAARAAEPWSVRMADSIMARSPRAVDIENPGKPREPKWSYSTAFGAYSIGMVGIRSSQPKYLDYARGYADAFVDKDGAIASKSFVPDHQKLDDVAPGRLLLLLHAHTKDPRYLKASDALAELLRHQPRTSDRGFWHKQIYPHQMWLDGAFMGCPFMTQYGRVAADPMWADEAVHQLLTVARHTHDPRTGLFYHGWDESRGQRWADPQTGRSPSFWGRAVGWYVMAVADTLEELPSDHPRRGELVTLLQNLADAIVRVQHPQSGVWYQVLDQADREGNYAESSASCMFVYAMAKGARLGHLSDRHLDAARRGYAGIIERFIETDASTGRVALKDTCQVAGLGGRPYRDGSFEYYMREPRISNDPKGFAPFILASLELEHRAAKSQ